MTVDDADLPALSPEDAAEADELLRGATVGGRAREALGTHLEALISTGQMVAVRTPTKHADGSPRGVAALIPDGSTRTGERRRAGFVSANTPPAPRPATPTTQTASAAAIAARMVEGDWLICDPDDGLLHHARLTPAQLTSLAVNGLADTAVGALVTQCLHLPVAASRPGEVHRRTRERCGSCASALGYPGGVGSPVLDGACATVLERRQEELG